MQILIAALPRSGSTMLAGLIQKPQDRLCLREPDLRFPHKGIDRFNAQMRPWNQRFGSKRSGMEWINTHIRSWSAKEVDRASILYMINNYRPEKIIVLVRDIRHAAVSLREELLRLYGDGVSAYDWFRVITLPVANLLIELSALPNSKVVRYENFCCEPTERSELEEWAGFSLDGNLKAAFEADECLDPANARMDEYRFHEGRITPNSILRRKIMGDPGDQIHAQFAAHLASGYQNFFGYPASIMPMNLT